MKLQAKYLVILLVVLLATMTGALAAESNTFVVANTDDWQAMYLTAIYAKFIEAEFVYIKDLGDAELKTQLMAPDDNVFVFESTETPVVKNYQSFLTVNGFNSVGEYKFFTAYDLQEYLYTELEPEEVFIFGNDFGMEPITLAPYLLQNNFFPMFYSQESTDFFYRISRRKPVTVVGRVPIRSVEQLHPTYISGQPQKTTSEVTKIVTDHIKADWGVITRVDSIDYDSIRKELPVFVFYSQTYAPQLADSIKESEVRNFEVIGGNTADLAQGLEAEVGEDLNMMLKFGRKITNFDGLENKVLGVDAVNLPFPYEEVALDAVKYYEDLNIFTITLSNNGNLPVYVFSNIDFGGEVVSDETRHAILPGTAKTIPYDLVAENTNEQAILTIRYGYALPLQNTLLGDQGTPIIQRDVEIVNYAEEPQISFTKNDFNQKTGLLSIGYLVETQNDVFAVAEMQVGEEVYTSEKVTLSPGRSPAIPIEFPYVANSELLHKSFNVTIHYGEKDLLFSTTQELFIEPQPNNTIYVIAGLGIVVIIIVIVLLLTIKKKKRKTTPSSKEIKSTGSSKATKKKTPSTTTKRKAQNKKKR